MAENCFWFRTAGSGIMRKSGIRFRALGLGLRALNAFFGGAVNLRLKATRHPELHGLTKRP